MTKNNKSVEYQILGDNILKCLRCGEMHEIPVPQPMYGFSKEICSFLKRHADCKAPSKGGYQHRYAGSF